MKRLALALCVVALVSCKKAEEAAPPPADTTAVPAAPVDSMTADSIRRADSLRADTTKPN